MSVLAIRVLGDPVLRLETTPVTVVTDEVRQLIDDMFDCVAPTRMGRNAAAFTPDGRVNMRRAEFRADDRPVVETCGCGCCRRFSRAYIRHLFQADEMLGARLLSLHNVHFLIALVREARRWIIAGEFAAWSREWLARYHSQPTRS